MLLLIDLSGLSLPTIPCSADGHNMLANALRTYLLKYHKFAFRLSLGRVVPDLLVQLQVDLRDIGTLL